MSSLPPIDFKVLFRDPDMFDNKDAFRAAGFDVRQAQAHNIMVGRHPSVPDHLFKKHSGLVPPDKQRANYEQRAKVAQRIRTFIHEERLRHIIVPQKWVHDLSSRFAKHGKPASLLVVERLDLLHAKETAQRYRDIDKDVLEELCQVLHTFRDIDAAPHNVPFTSSGQIAFIDTEKRPENVFFYYIRQELSESSRRRADRMFAKLAGR